MSLPLILDLFYIDDQFIIGLFYGLVRAVYNFYVWFLEFNRNQLQRLDHFRYDIV